MTNTSSLYCVTLTKQTNNVKTKCDRNDMSQRVCTVTTSFSNINSKKLRIIRFYHGIDIRFIRYNLYIYQNR